MKLKKVLVIINIHAGQGSVAENLGMIVDTMNRAGYEVTVYSTLYHGHATKLIREYGAEYPLVICSGGDGTLNEIVDGLMLLPEEKRPDIGYLPAGSTNDYASSLNLPVQPEDGIAMITQGHFRKVDVGRFNDSDYFVYVAAFGAFTEVSYNTPQSEKNLWGHQAYIIRGIQQAANIKPYHMKVTISGGDEAVLDNNFIYGMVYNANSVGGFKNLSGKPVELDDGQLDAMFVVCPATGIEWPALLADFVTKNPQSKYILTYRAKSFHFEGDQGVDWTLDGEYGGTHSTVRIETCHQAMSIAVPDGSAPAGGKNGEKAEAAEKQDAESRESMKEGEDPAAGGKTAGDAASGENEEIHNEEDAAEAGRADTDK